jgi:predicted dehydrogenase
MSKKNHSICFLGTSKINKKHISIVRKLRPKSRLAVASRNQDSAKDYARQQKLSRAFGSYQEAFESGYETFVIGVPPRLHAELIAQGLEAQKNMLIEKPITNSLDELKLLWNKIQETQKVVMVAENLHFSPFNAKLIRTLEQKQLGSPMFLEVCRFGVARLSGWRSDPKQMHWGALHEGGVHWIRRLLSLAAHFEPDHTPGVKSVQAFQPAFRSHPKLKDDNLWVIARHNSGLISRLTHAWGLPWRSLKADQSRLLLSDGAVYFDSRSMFGRVYKKKSSRLLTPVLKDPSGYRAMWQGFIEAIENNQPAPLSMETIWHDMAYMDAAYRSLESGEEETPRTVPR